MRIKLPLAMFFITALLWTCSAVAQHADVNLIERRITESIVFIHSEWKLPNGLSAPGDGTGFVVTADGYVLTCAHILADADSPGNGTLSITGIIGAREGISHRLSLVQRDIAQDLALLKFESPIAYSPVNAVTRRVSIGDDVLAFGFPFSYSLTFARGSITNTSVEGGLWLTDAPVNRGHSGGPAVSPEGDVIGVVKAGIEGAQGMRLVIPIARASSLFGIAGVSISSDASRPGAVTPPTNSVTVTGTRVAPVAPCASANDGSPLPEPAIRGVQYELSSAMASGNSLTVVVNAINRGPDALLVLRDPIRSNSFGAELVVDDGTYFPESYRVSNQRQRGKIISGTCTPITLRFEKMPTVVGRLRATRILRLTMTVYTVVGNQTEIDEIVLGPLSIQKN